MGEVWVLTDKDIEHYSQTVPNLKSTSDINNAILAMSLDMLADWYKRKLSTQASLWYDVSWMQGIYKQLINQAEELRAWIWNTNQSTLQSTQSSSFKPAWATKYDTSTSYSSNSYINVEWADFPKYILVK